MIFSFLKILELILRTSVLGLRDRSVELECETVDSECWILNLFVTKRMECEFSLLRFLDLSIC